MSARWWSLGVWALAAASALFWGFRLFVAAPAVPPHAQTADASAAPRGDLSRLFGVDAPPPVAAAAAEPAADARFQLIGVVSPRSPQAASEGLALIAVDGKPPKAYRIGSVVDGQNVLKSVGARGATLGPRDGAAAVALNLAPVAAAATGSLPVLPGAAAPLPPPAPAMPSTPNIPGGVTTAPPPLGYIATPQARPQVTLPPGVPQVGPASRRHLPAAQDTGEPNQTTESTNTR